MNLLKIETRTQEILLLLTGLLAACALFGEILFLFVTPHTLLRFMGAWGANTLQEAYAIWGYAILAAPFFVFACGAYLVGSVKEPGDFTRVWQPTLALIFAKLCFIGVFASVLTILKSFSTGAKKVSLLAYGPGGKLGLAIGGTLYKELGLFGSLSSLLGVALIVGIATRQIVLVNLIFLFRDLALGTLKGMKNKIAGAFLELRQRAEKHQKKKASLVLLEEHAESRSVANFGSVNVSGGYSESITHGPRTAYPSRLVLVKDGHTVIQNIADLRLPPVPAPAAKAAPAAEETPEKKAPAKPRKKKPKVSEDLKANEVEAPEKNKEEEKSDSEALAIKPQLVPYKKKYLHPDASLLNKSKPHKRLSDKILDGKGKELEERLKSFGITGKITEIHPGIRLTMFEYLPDSGMKLSKIQALTSDLALLLGAPNIRMLAPIPGKTTVGFEIPNEESSSLSFSDLLPDLKKKSKDLALPIALGKNVYGDVLISDLSAMPHLLVSGTTGSGKSVFMNSLITSLLYTRSPKELRMLMIDPKMIELTPYNGIPHLMLPVVSDVEKAKDSLIWTEREMDRRYQVFAEIGARNIVSFNEQISKSSAAAIERKLGKKPEWEIAEMPYIVVIVDELADLMITQGKLVEIPITRIAQKARACGIHLVLSTQRPSSEIVTGLIKTNFPTRIAFKVSSGVDSRTILDASGAEGLLGNGDMLYKPNGKAIERLQGSFISEAEVTRVVESILRGAK